MTEQRTLVTFRSDVFNTTEERDGFINPENYGDDVARWLMEALRRRGIEADGDPGQEDHGWYFTFRCGGVEHDFVVGWADGEWIGWVERRAGLFASLMGARRRGIAPEAVRDIHEALSGAPEIRDVRWHVAAAFQAGDTDNSTPEPLA